MRLLSYLNRSLSRHLMSSISTLRCLLPIWCPSRKITSIQLFSSLFLLILYFVSKVVLMRLISLIIHTHTAAVLLVYISCFLISEVTSFTIMAVNAASSPKWSCVGILTILFNRTLSSLVTCSWSLHTLVRHGHTPSRSNLHDQDGLNSRIFSESSVDGFPYDTYHLSGFHTIRPFDTPSLPYRSNRQCKKRPNASPEMRLLHFAFERGKP